MNARAMAAWVFIAQVAACTLKLYQASREPGAREPLSWPQAQRLVLTELAIMLCDERRQVAVAALGFDPIAPTWDAGGRRVG